MSVNKIIVLGRLGDNIKITTTNSGTKIGTVSVATSENYVQDGVKKQATEWHRLIFWGKRADVMAQYTKKGDTIYAEGKMEYKSYTDKQGVERINPQVKVQNFHFISKSPAPAEGAGDYRPSHEGDAPLWD